MRPATFAQLFLLIGVSSSISNAKPSINWHDWQPKAFQEARDQNKLIVVNVGHEGRTACRYMENDTFSNASVIALHNKNS